MLLLATEFLLVGTGGKKNLKYLGKECLGLQVTMGPVFPRKLSQNSSDRQTARSIGEGQKAKT